MPACVHAPRAVILRSVSTTALIVTVIAVVVIAGAVYRLKTRGLRPVPEQLRTGSPLPDFSATDEQGNPLRSVELRGELLRG